MAIKTLTVTAILMSLAGQAAGQNALGNGGLLVNPVIGDRARSRLGDGRGLDLNPLMNSGGKNGPVRDFQAEQRFRDAIVTGNAPNGLSFRGDLPYSAPGDFRGQTGSNDLYAFRRDTLYSGLAGMGIRGTEALQQQFALTTGNRLPDLLSGSLTVNRFGAGDPNFANKVKNSLPSPSITTGIDPGTINRADPAFNLAPDFSGLSIEAGQELGTLRSTSAYTSMRGVQPTLLDIRTTPNQDLIGVTASTLRGIQSTPLGKSTLDNSVAGAKNTLGAGSTALPSAQGPGGAPPATTNPIASPYSTTTPDAVGNNAYNDLMDRLKTYAGAPANAGGADTRPEWQKQLDALRSELNASDMGATPAAPVPGPIPAAPADGAANPAGSPDAPASVPDGAPAPFTPSALAPLPPVTDFTFDPATVATLRNASGQINSLVPLTETADSAYADHMRIGQSQLSKGRYFDAEEEFTRAIATRPDDAMALLGRVHSQLGAGMNLSAWMNLRELFKNHPELLGARYGADLLPDAGRLTENTDSLRALNDKGGPLHREAAMLLAYVGYQSGNANDLQDGLAAMEKAKEGRADAISDLMIAVWSGKEPASAARPPGDAEQDAQPAAAPPEPEK